MKKRLITTCAIVFLLMCGCSSESQEHKNVNKKDNIKDENEPTAVTDSPMMFNDIGGLYNMYETAEIELFGDKGFIPGRCTVNDVRITKKFEQSSSEWSEYILEKLETEGDEIINDYSLIYIDVTVENLSDEKMDYNVSVICPMQVENEEMLIFAELAYVTDKGVGKSSYIKSLEAGGKINFTVGYIIEDKYMDMHMYIDVSGKGRNPGCILVDVPKQEEKKND